MKIDGNKVILEAGDKFEVIVNASAPAAAEVQQPSAEVQEKKPGQPVNFNLKIKNTRPTAVVIDNKINFVLANPDKNGFYYGDNNGGAYLGPYNRVAIILNGSYVQRSITIPAYGEVVLPINSSSVTGAVWCEGGQKKYGTDIVTGMGGRNLVPESYVKSAGWPASRGKSNVLLYVDGDSNVVVPTSLSSDICFVNGATYEIKIL